VIVDTHAHLCDPAFDSDRAEVLGRARAAGVTAVVCVGEGLEDARKNLALAARGVPSRAEAPTPGAGAVNRAAETPIRLLPAAGLYPGKFDRREAEKVVGLIRTECGRLRAVGEVGMDHWIAKEAPERELQRELFVRFVDLAVELDLPLNVHSRSAGRETIAVLLERGARRVQLHAFDGKASAALPAVEAGYFFSIPPSVVRSRQKQKLLAHLPLDLLLVESDSPVLGPEAAIRNEPANVIAALHTIAEIKGLEALELIAVVAANASRLYRLGER
jgi:TatD DNase family protein